MYRNRITSTIAHLLRGVLIFLLFCLVATALGDILFSVFSISDLRDTPELQEKVTPAMDIYASVFLLFIFYSLARALIVSDHRLCLGYVEDVPDHGRKTYATLTRNDTFLLEWASCFVLCIAFSAPTGPFAPVFGLLARLLPTFPALHAPLVVLMYSLLFGCLLLVAHRSAMTEWDSYHERQHKLLLESSTLIRFFKRPTGFFCALKKIVLCTYLYPLASYILWILILLFFIPVFNMLLREGLFIYILIAIVALILLTIARRYRRAVRARRTLTRRFEEVCRERGIEHTPVRYPYRSLLRTEEGADITITAKGIQYDVKLLAALNRSSRIFFAPGNQMLIRRTIKLFHRHLELFHIDTTIYYTMPGDHKKLLVICPTPARMFVTERGRTREIDTGERIGDYTLYTATGFVNAIDRDCLPKT